MAVEGFRSKALIIKIDGKVGYIEDRDLFMEGFYGQEDIDNLLYYTILRALINIDIIEGFNKDIDN